MICRQEVDKSNFSKFRKRLSACIKWALGYRIVQDRLFTSDFDRAIEQIGIEHKPSCDGK